MIGSCFAGKNYGLIYCIITKISFGRKPKRPSSMDRAAKIVIQTIITFRTSLWILKEKGGGGESKPPRCGKDEI